MGETKQETKTGGAASSAGESATKKEIDAMGSIATALEPLSEKLG